MPTARVSIVLILTSAFTALAGGDAPSARSPVQPVAHRRAEGARNVERQREGTKLVDVAGRFEQAGDRITFQPGGERESFRMLENLALERVGQVLAESRVKHDWTISGVLTEYRGANYLLLQKAVIKSATEPR